MSVEVQVMSCGQIGWIGGEKGVPSHARSSSLVRLLGFRRRLHHFPITPAWCTAGLRDTVAFSVHSPQDADAVFQQHLTFYLNRIQTSVHSSLVCILWSNLALY